MTGLKMPSRRVNLKLIQVNSKAYEAWFNRDRQGLKPIPKERWEKILKDRKRFDKAITGKETRGYLIHEEFPGQVDYITTWLANHGFKYRVLKKEMDAII